MVHERLKTERGLYVELEYDKEKFYFEYIKDFNIIIFRRLSDNKVLHIFGSSVNFIIQHNNDNETSFMVCENLPSEKIPKLNHYSLPDENSNKLGLIDTFNISWLDLNHCRINNDCYLIDENSVGGFIYNVKSKNYSKKYSRIYPDKKLNNFLDDNTLLVSEKMTATFSSYITDTITYGINLETLEITTPIYSALQDRWIEVYTPEQVDELDRKLRNQGYFLNKKYNLEEITIGYEIQHYLDLLYDLLPSEKSVYLDYDTTIDKEFVKGFTKK